MKKLAALVVCLAACKPSPPLPAAAPDAGVTVGPGARLESKALLEQVDRLKEQMKGRPKSFEVLAALGALYYENARWLEAVDSLREALELSRPIEQRRAALRAQGVKPAAELPAECRRAGADYGLARIAAAAAKLEPALEARCLEAALEPVRDAHAHHADALYLIGNADGALEEHKAILAESPDFPESLFFVGAITLEQSNGDKAKLADGKKFWERLLEVAPQHPRADLVRESLPRAEQIFGKRAPPAGAAMADSTDGEPLPPGHPSVGRGEPGAPMAHGGPDPALVQQVAEAAQGTERTPELEKGLDELVKQADAFLDAGKYQEARDALVRVMPMRPNDPHTAADLGGAMRGLGRAEMAERVLGRALQLDPKQPRALYELGKLLAQRGDRAGAADRLRALQSADPGFAKSHRVEAELQALK